MLKIIASSIIILLALLGSNSQASENTLISFSGLGDPVTVGSATYPDVSISPKSPYGTGTITISTGLFSGGDLSGSVEVLGHVQFIPQHFYGSKNRPICVFQWLPKTNPLITISTATVIQILQMNDLSIGYSKDINGNWIVGLDIDYSVAGVNPDPYNPYYRPTTVPFELELDFICPPDTRRNPG